MNVNCDGEMSSPPCNRNEESLNQSQSLSENGPEDRGPGPPTPSDKLVTGASCKALRTAVSTLYPIDDFIKEKIAFGFFSDVFKVSGKHFFHSFATTDKVANHYIKINLKLKRIKNHNNELVL